MAWEGTTKLVVAGLSGGVALLLVIYRARCLSQEMRLRWQKRQCERRARLARAEEANYWRQMAEDRDLATRANARAAEYEARAASHAQQLADCGEAM